MTLYCIKEYESMKSRSISDFSDIPLWKHNRENDWFQDLQNFKCGVTKGNFYKMTDEDNIGYRIIDDFNRNYWVIKSCFLNPEETRELKLNQLCSI